MKNFTLLLVLVSGLLAGYFVGDYRGRAARDALQKAVATGRALNAELESSSTRLKGQLDLIQKQHARELQGSREEYDRKLAEWERVKASMDKTIQRQHEATAEADARLQVLMSRLENAKGTSAVQVAQEMEQVRRERDAMRREMAGNVCLKTPVPEGVVETLNTAENGKPLQ
jgi:DNA repair exonuclease SbcCD ATPase subunit